MEEISPIANSPDLWDNRERAERILKEKSYLEGTVGKCSNLKGEIDYYNELMELSDNDESTSSEINKNLKILENSIKILEIEVMFSDDDDKN
ncbi:MAG: PCRF domain-containing protein, partial [Rickettsiales bacterium]|nr:PCRF domain-containing protein [Rickettsiales bacterium]